MNLTKIIITAIIICVHIRGNYTNALKYTEYYYSYALSVDKFTRRKDFILSVNMKQLLKLVIDNNLNYII